MKLGIELGLEQLADMRATLLAGIQYLKPECSYAPTRARRDAASALAQRLQRAHSLLPASADPLGSVGTARLSRAVAITCGECGHEDDAHRFLTDDPRQRQCPNCQALMEITYP